MKWIKPCLMIFVLAAALALFSPPALAQQCLTEVSTTTSTSRATTGTSVTITVTTTGTSCTINTLALVSSPSLTINDPASGQYSGFSAGTAKAFTITAGTAGTYTYYARGTTSSGSVDSTQQILEFISPSDLTVTASPSSATVLHNNMFNLTVSVQNPQSSAVTTSYALNLPSGLTRNSGDPASSSGTSVSASSTKSLTFEVKHSTCFTGSKTITFDLGDTSGAASVSVTGNSSCDTGAAAAAAGGGGGGGGGGAALAEVHTFSQIKSGVAAVKKFTNTAIALKEISIEVNNPANNVKITVTKLAGQPASITKSVSGKVFQYIEINASLPNTNIKASKLSFDVSKSWLSQNGFEASNVVLQRYTADWEKLPTTILSEDANNVKYEATSTGFSVFAIAAEKPAAPAQPPAPGEQPPAPAPGEQPPAQLPEQPPAPITFPTAGIDALYVAIILAIILGLGFYYYYHWGKKKPE